MTPQQLWRTAVETSKTEESSVSEGPSPIWRAQFLAQATDDMMDDVCAYVAKRATWVEHQQGRRAPGLIREMVQDAIGDTFVGIVAWDPSRCPLALHLKSVVRSRLSHDLERVEQFSHVGMADASESDVHEVMEAQAKPAADPTLDRYVDEFYARLRELAKEDEPVLVLLDANMAGFIERAHVCRATGMTKAGYHNAHRRLKRLADNLPEHLRAAALDALT